MERATILNSQCFVGWIKERICREDELLKGQHILALKPKLNVKSYLCSSGSASCPHQIHFHHWHQFVWSPIRQNSRGEANRADDDNCRSRQIKERPNHLLGKYFSCCFFWAAVKVIQLELSWILDSSKTPILQYMMTTEGLGVLSHDF